MYWWWLRLDRTNTVSSSILWFPNLWLIDYNKKKLEPPYATIWSAPYRWKMRNGLIGWQGSVSSTVQQMTSVLRRHHVSVTQRTNVEPALINRLELVMALIVQLKLIIWLNTWKNMPVIRLNVGTSPKPKPIIRVKYFVSIAEIHSPCLSSVSTLYNYYYNYYGSNSSSVKLLIL